MRFDDVVIASLASVHAPVRVPTADMEARLDLPRLGLLKGTLVMLSGIEARHFYPIGTLPSDAATEAAEMALEGVDRDRVGLLINTSVCRDYIEPSTACLVHGNLKLGPDCHNFDISNACLGFLNGMVLAAQMLQRGDVEWALIVDGECARFVVEKTMERLMAPDASPQTLRENLATLTLGSGAAAATLTRRELCEEGHAFNAFISQTASQHNHLCRGQVDWMKTDATGLLSAGVELGSRTWDRAVEQLGWTLESIDHAVMHQVSKAHTEAIARSIGLTVEQVPVIYREHGNVGPASVPMTLASAVASGRVKRGDKIGLMGIGSGLNCAMADVDW